MPGFSDVLVVTGGIGSGKSFVTGLLKEIGWEVADADVLGHEALERKKTDILARWPVVGRAGSVDRKALAGIVFSDAAELEELELITHPVIEDLIREWVSQSAFPMAIEMSASSFMRRLTGTPTLVVDASVSRRRGRAIARGMGLNDWEARLAAQPGRAEWLAYADFVFDNDTAGIEGTSAIAEFDNFWRHR